MIHLISRASHITILNCLLTNQSFSLFAVLFEVVSAYGTVGLSLGYPTANTSFCAQFRTISKLVIVAMEIRGRHRGLPYALDRAILLPSERLHRVETEEMTRKLQHQEQHEQQTENHQQKDQGITPSSSAAATADAVVAADCLPAERSADGLSNATTSFRRRRGSTGMADKKGKGFGGFLQGALSAGPVRANTWKGV